MTRVYYYTPGTRAAALDARFITPCKAWNALPAASERIWHRILADLHQQVDAEGKLDWSLHYVDGTVIRAHQHAAGAQMRGSIT